ncbi:DUF2894 domain-containing protein [Polaromonas sp. SM01]|uniref:DUF2894 domain-containing protein n=1 Tax=Polaromonas sp. SM01 TaxID=3085630 RepID=UPI0029819FAF|nr:DUF2894 domain-containing protein [Polaromonas sp. SM01]MDW5443088.1 DUF2894 domain-containing protein [Polaromonas sp. SM01]
MSESGLSDMPHAQPEGETSLLSWQASLRKEGAQHFDPARFHYLELLSQRMDAAPGEVRRILESKFKVALADYGERFRQAQKSASDELASLSVRHPDLARELQRLFAAGDYAGMRRLGAKSALKKPCVPLGQLNQYLQKVKQEGIDHHLESGLGSSLLSNLAASSEMASVRRFRESWSRMAAEDQVKQSVGRGPANAGPMNSHMLVLRSLALMRKLSPDYLQRFMSHVETLLWLDQANQKFALTKTKPVRRSRPKK